MSQSTSVKMCKVCGKDVSSAKRVKDPKGTYFCEPCYAAATAGGPAKKAPEPQSAPPSDGDEYDLKPTGPAPQRVRPVAAVAGKPAPAVANSSGLLKAGDKREQILPKNCPNCGMVMRPGTRICMKCNRDVTRMDKLLALQASADLPPPTEEVIGNIVGKIIKIAVYVVVAGVAVFLLWGAYLTFFPGGPFDDYPTHRVELIKEYLGDIAKGTDKSYKKAFQLVSFRVRTTNNTQEFNLYEFQYKKMHDEFAKKYGADWISKVTVTPEYKSNGELAPYVIKIGGDTYHISTQVQVPADDAILSAVGRKIIEGPEDGRNHFGIFELVEYSAHPPPPVKNRPAQLDLNDTEFRP